MNNKETYCPYCGNLVQIRKDGKLRRHHRVPIRPKFKQKHCIGSLMNLEKKLDENDKIELACKKNSQNY